MTIPDEDGPELCEHCGHPADGIGHDAYCHTDWPDDTRTAVAR